MTALCAAVARGQGARPAGAGDRGGALGLRRRLSARRALGAGAGPEGRRGVANVSCTTVDKLVRQLGGPVLAARGLRLAPGPVDLEAIRTEALASAGLAGRARRPPAGPAWRCATRSPSSGGARPHARRRWPGARGPHRRPVPAAGRGARAPARARLRRHRRPRRGRRRGRGGDRRRPGRPWARCCCLDPGAMAPSERRVLDLVMARTGDQAVVHGRRASARSPRSAPVPTPTKRCAPRCGPWWPPSTPGCRRGRRPSSIPPGPATPGPSTRSWRRPGVAANGPETRRLDRSVAGATLARPARAGRLRLGARTRSWPGSRPRPIVAGPDRRRVPASRWDCAVVGGRRGARRGAVGRATREPGRTARRSSATRPGPWPAFVEDLVDGDGRRRAGRGRPTPRGRSACSTTTSTPTTGSWPDEELAAAEQVRGAVLGAGRARRACRTGPTPARFDVRCAPCSRRPRSTPRSFPTAASATACSWPPSAGPAACTSNASCSWAWPTPWSPGRSATTPCCPRASADSTSRAGCAPGRPDSTSCTTTSSPPSGPARRDASPPTRASTPAPGGPRCRRAGWRRSPASAPDGGPVDSFAAGIASARPPAVGARARAPRHRRAGPPQGRDPARSPLALSSDRLADRDRCGTGPDGTGLHPVRRERRSGPGVPVPGRGPDVGHAPRGLRQVPAPVPLRPRACRSPGAPFPRRSGRWNRPSAAPWSTPSSRSTSSSAWPARRGRCPGCSPSPRRSSRPPRRGGLVGKALLWRMDKAAIRRDLARFHDEEGDLEPLAAELEFGTGAEGADPAVTVTLDDGLEVRFKGKADRVDRARSGELVVSDYKTGKQGMLSGPAEGPRGRGPAPAAPDLRHGGAGPLRRGHGAGAVLAAVGKARGAVLQPHHHRRGPGALRRRAAA